MASVPAHAFPATWLNSTANGLFVCSTISQLQSVLHCSRARPHGRLTRTNVPCDSERGVRRLLKRGSDMGGSLLRHATKRLGSRSRLVVFASVIALAAAGLSAPGASASPARPTPSPNSAAKKPSTAALKAQALARKPAPFTPAGLGLTSTKPPKGKASSSQAPKRPTPVVRKHGLPASLANVPVKAQRWGTMHPQEIVGVVAGKAGSKPTRPIAYSTAPKSTRPVVPQTSVTQVMGTTRGTVVNAVYSTALSASSPVSLQTAVVPATGTITGTVTDATTHAPLAGVCAVAYDYANTSGTPTGCTDATGLYTIANVPAGQFEVVFEDHVNSHQTQWWNGAADAQTASIVTVTSGATIDRINAALAQGGSIAGTITGVGGVPLAQVCASITTLAGVYVNAGGCSDSTGHFQTIGLPAGAYDVVFDDQAGPYMEQWYNGKTTQASANSVAVTLGSVTATANIAMQRGGSISGTVTDSVSHAAVPGSCLAIYASGGNQDYAGSRCTDSSGQYTSPGLATGSYKVEFYDGSGAGHLPQWWNNKPDQASATSISVTLGVNTSAINADLQLGGKITGTVTDAVTHAGVPNLCADVYRAGALGTIGAGCSDSTGAYTAVGLPTGNYQVVFNDYSAAGYLSQWWNNKPDQASATSIPVTQGATTQAIDAALVVGGKITGTVTDAVTHAGIANVCAYVHTIGTSTGWGGLRGCTDASGAYAAVGVPTGSYQVEFVDYSAGHLQQWWNNKLDQASSTSVSVTQGVTTPAIDAALQMGGKITGIVTDAVTHAGIAGLCPGVYQAGTLTGMSAGSAGCTDNSGTYTAVGLPSGSYQVEFNDYGWPGFVVQWWQNKPDQASATSVPVTVGTTTSGIGAALVKLGSLSGTITAAGASPTTLCASAYAASNISAPIARVCADPTGHYILPGLPTGQYLVRFIDYGGTHVESWYNGKADAQSADLVRVNIGADTPNINETLTPGGWVTGTVTDSVTHAGVSGVCVSIWDPSVNAYEQT